MLLFTNYQRPKRRVDTLCRSRCLNASKVMSDSLDTVTFLFYKPNDSNLQPVMQFLI